MIKELKKILSQSMCRILTICGLAVIFSISAQSQTLAVKGIVTEVGGQPLRGVSVMLKGTTVATITDEYGEYEIPVHEQRAVLVFVLKGFQTMAIPVNGRNLIDVVMRTDSDNSNDTAGKSNVNSKHEVSIYGGGGLSTLSYSTEIGDVSSGFGGHLGLGYHYFITSQIGIGTGVEVSLYSSKYSLNELKTSTPATDISGNAFEFRSVMSKYEENQSVMMLQIPVMLQFRQSALYAAIGGKVGIPLSMKYDNTCASISNTGYYADENAEYDTQHFVGFGTFNDLKNKGDFNFSTAFLLSVEAGFRSKSFAAGAYLDYGLNNISNATSTPLVEYKSDIEMLFNINSILNSQQGGKAFAEKIAPLSVGIKVKFLFGM